MTTVMNSGSRRVSRHAHHSFLLALWAIALSIVLISTPGGATKAAADTAVSPVGGLFTVTGRGFGHGIGMSQYGSYGGATLGKTWQQMVAFYYSGTTIASQSTTRTIRVWITADTDKDLQVYPSAGLRLHAFATGQIYTLPTGTKYTRWRTTRTATGYALHYRNTLGTWVKITPPLNATAIWTFENTAKIIKVLLPGSLRREFRSQVSLIKTATAVITTNRLPVEDYLRSVVPSEMPTNWPTQAVQTQAVAARTYAARLQAAAATAPAAAFYDVCDTVACQVYKGYATTVSGIRTLHETAAGTLAVQRTAGRILTYLGNPALAMFSSSNGGFSAPGSQPYLQAKADSWDGIAKSQAWTKTLTTAVVKQAYPNVGTIRQLQVLTRDGFGAFGGRVLTIKIIGSTGSTTVTGPAFRTAMGLRSALFRL
ncbi:MAG TPA: SpoIID/LytB domain-containing protein [Propionibacteriaceae bacterium]|nr:SpoIID/LytB domain-containing protein [Propionibacteriaceae bacterium]